MIENDQRVISDRDVVIESDHRVIRNGVGVIENDHRVIRSNHRAPFVITVSPFVIESDPSQADFEVQDDTAMIDKVRREKIVE